MSPGESSYLVDAMLIDTAGNVVGYANIQGTVSLVGQNVDMECLHDSNIPASRLCSHWQKTPIPVGNKEKRLGQSPEIQSRLLSPKFRVKRRWIPSRIESGMTLLRTGTTNCGRRPTDLRRPGLEPGPSGFRKATARRWVPSRIESGMTLLRAGTTSWDGDPPIFVAPGLTRALVAFARQQQDAGSRPGSSPG